jgi:aminoacyl tRNA synthase complex-interacting multifunctional protein 1
MSKASALTLLDNWIAELEVSVGSSSLPSPPTNSNKSQQKAPAEKKAPKAEKKAAPAAAPQQEGPLNVNALDLRVGVIRSVKKHDTAEKLYCEEIDVGEEAPRAIASGLVPYYSLEQMQDRKLIVVCNLKPRNLVGFKSHGMVLCASKTNADGTTSVEFVDPPAGSKPGDRISGEGFTEEPLTASKGDKVKAWETLAPDLRVDENGVARWKDVRLVDPSGNSCIAPTIREAAVH